MSRKKKGANMAGTKEGGDKTAETIRQRYNEDFYAEIGKIGGASFDKTKGEKGFALADKDSLRRMARYARYCKFRKEFTERRPNDLLPSVEEWDKRREYYKELLRR